MLDKTATEMMEYICDSLCRYPDAVTSGEVLEEICEECRLMEYVKAITRPGENRREGQNEVQGWEKYIKQRNAGSAAR